MRRRRFPLPLAAAAGSLLLFSLAFACASKPRGPLPTLSDYSDGVSDWSERFLADWRAGRGLPADPLKAYVASGYQDRIAADRVGGTQASWGA